MQTSGNRLFVACGIMALATSLQGADTGTNKKDRYAPLSNKANIPICQKAALLLYPGSVKALQILNLNGSSLLQFRISSREGLERLVLCDAATGRIIHK